MVDTYTATVDDLSCQQPVVSVFSCVDRPTPTAGRSFFITTELGDYMLQPIHFTTHAVFRVADGVTFVPGQLLTLKPDGQLVPRVRPSTSRDIVVGIAAESFGLLSVTVFSGKGAFQTSVYDKTVTNWAVEDRLYSNDRGELTNVPSVTGQVVGLVVNPPVEGDQPMTFITCDDDAQ